MNWTMDLSFLVVEMTGTNSRKSCFTSDWLKFSRLARPESPGSPLETVRIRTESKEGLCPKVIGALERESRSGLVN